MNYLRGALQYYKDLPPINPSTLTGAIDVIVVERPNADPDGPNELASTPFHVRFGKWQILRPGDKKVSVSVNGQLIPFPMKIGEAGEAFFVFETEEDISDELVTSPVTSPTLTPLPRPSPTLEANPRNQLPQDPPPLDLNEESTQPFATPEDPLKNTDTITKPSNLLDKTMALGQTLITAAVEEQREVYDKMLDSAHALSDVVHGESFTHEEIVREAEEVTPHVLYKNDITLDASGYHIGHDREMSEETVTSDDYSRRPPARTQSQGSSGSNITIPASGVTTPAPSSGASMPTSPDLPNLKLQRGASAPPELQLTTVPASQLEYEWEWGAFPQPTPTKHAFTDPYDTYYRSSNARQRDESTSLAATILEEEEVTFGLGGLLTPDASDPYHFVLDLDGVMMTFQLSFSGPTSSDRSIVGEIADIDGFEKHRVSYRKLMANASTVRSPDLVIRWGDKLITRSDSSPLFGALVHWRENTLSSQGYTSDGEQLSSGEDFSDDENSRAKKHTPKSKSGWSRWFSRGWTDRSNQQDPTKLTPSPISLEAGPSSPFIMRPSLQSTSSEPIPIAAEPSLKLQLPESRSNSRPRGEPLSIPAEQKKVKRFAKTLRLTSEQLWSLNLKAGANDMTFSLSNADNAICTARIFLWDSTDHIVVSDIDGTITKSDALGHVLTLIGRDWTHLGVAKLYTDICRNGYKIMYLTSRAIGQADSTRDYLKGINQNNRRLPEGPVIMSPDRLMASLHREVIMRKPEVFKMACLRDIARLFGNTSRNPFYAGFGNRITDALSYRSVNIPSTKIFTIDSTGEVKTELLERAGYKSSYIHMYDLVDQQFPPIHRKWAVEFTDFNYWRPPLEDTDFPDLTPPSPTLSARSDTSNQSTLSRLRHFSIGRAASKNISGLPTVRIQTADEEGRKLTADGHGRSPSSLSVLRNIVGYAGSSPPSEPVPVPSKYVGRPASRSGSESMPGSLPDESHFPIDLESGNGRRENDEEDYDDDDDGGEDGDGDGDGDGEDGNNLEEDMDELFDEDLLATGEMKHVPFL